MKYHKISTLFFLSTFLISCLAGNTAVESGISKSITNGLHMERFPNTEKLYPKGKYETLEELKSKTPTSNIDFNKSQMKHIISANYQLRDLNGKRIKDPLAVSSGDELFINVKKLKNILSANNKKRLANTNNDFLKAYYVNEDFAYFETEVVSDYFVVQKFKRVGILYDSRTNNFVVFDQNKVILKFLDENFPDIKIDYFNNTAESPHLGYVRELILQVFEK